MEMDSEIWTAKVRILAGWYEHLVKRINRVRYLCSWPGGTVASHYGSHDSKTAKINRGLLVISEEMLYFHICYIVSCISIVIIDGSLN